MQRSWESKRRSRNPELHFSDGGAGLASLVVVCSFRRLSHGGTTVAFHPGCDFKVRMPLFLMLNRFVRVALGWGYGRLRGRPFYTELCFNGLSYHWLIVFLQVALCHSTCFAMTLCTSVSPLFSYPLSSFSLVLHMAHPPTPPLSSKPLCLGPLVLAKLLPHDDSLIVVIQWQREPWFESAENMCHCFSGQTERQLAPGGDDNHEN